MTQKPENKTALGDRMKLYEQVSRHCLMPRGYVCIRCDGRSFHNYTKGLARPFDKGLMADMDATAVYLCENIQGAKVGYVQSDEISVITANFGDFETQTFFDGNIQKISSVVASMATAKFNQLRYIRGSRWFDMQTGMMCMEKKVADISGMPKTYGQYTPSEAFDKIAMFDCRCWNVPNNWEAYNTLVWRQQDAIRNSISSVAQSFYSHNELNGKDQTDMHEMLHQKGINWVTDYTDGEKNGRVIVKESYPMQNRIDGTDMQRNRWVSNGAWKFTEDKEKLLGMIPKYE